MSKTAKVLITIGALGTVAGVGYAIASHRREKNADEKMEESDAQTVSTSSTSRPAGSSTMQQTARGTWPPLNQLARVAP